MPKQYKNHSERLLSKVKVDANGCWLWTAAIGQGNGYGTLTINKVKVLAHRVSYEVFKGPIPDNLYVCHSCDVKECINPDHLWLGTPKDNSTDMVNKGRHNNQNKFKTHCPKGHEYTPENTTFSRTRTKRTCRECKRASEKARYQRNKFKSM